MLTRCEICSNMVAPFHGPVLKSLKWRCSGIDFVLAILSWIGLHPSIAQTQHMDANSKNLFSHDAWFSFLQVPTHCKKCQKQRNLVIRRIGALHRCLGDWVRVEESTSAANIVALRVGRLIPRRVALRHFSNRKNLFYNNGSHGELPFHAAHRHGLV
jgi:hypothetical protein